MATPTPGFCAALAPCANPANGGLPEVPRFAADGVTQLGTGYTVGTGDITTRYWLAPNLVVTAAANVFRQYDTPRTD